MACAPQRIANNIANADTPGYKEVDFAEALRRAADDPVALNAAGKLAPGNVISRWQERGLLPYSGLHLNE